MPGWLHTLLHIVAVGATIAGAYTGALPVWAPPLISGVQAVLAKVAYDTVPPAAQPTSSSK